jgi:hypothetical protein
MSWYQTADDTSEDAQAPTRFEPGEASPSGACAPSGRSSHDQQGGITTLARWLVGALAGAALIALLVHARAHTLPRIATITHTTVTSHVAPTPNGEQSPEPATAVTEPLPTPVPTPREVIPSAGVVESVPAGSPFSPLITFTVENTGAVVAELGRVTTTDPAFRISRDDCSRTALPPGGVCHVTLQFAARTSGRHAGLLVVPVGGSPTQTASLRAAAT